ncbi:class I SAM-dependent methyltransferase [Oscillospiraceae bacterium MB08-C2-2]|nr:class I SAM-dependent methyltransferase [Oscillospiraceae bacterium MB08-C2-2]
MPGDLNSLVLSHQVLTAHVKEGNFCIDATAGRGRDTAFYCSLVGETGRVLTFDIQQEALDSTAKLLEKEGYTDRAKLVLDSHSNMALYAQPGTADAIGFNLGWLPGGDHSLFTKPDTSIAAIEAGLEILRVGGLMSIGIYYGGQSGFEERDALLAYLPTLDPSRYTVMETHFCNRPNNPSIAVFIVKDE